MMSTYTVLAATTLHAPLHLPQEVNMILVGGVSENTF